MTLFHIFKDAIKLLPPDALCALKEFLSVYVHTQSIKIGLEDESKSFFFMFSTKLWFT